MVGAVVDADNEVVVSVAVGSVVVGGGVGRRVSVGTAAVDTGEAIGVDVGSSIAEGVTGASVGGS